MAVKGVFASDSNIQGTRVGDFASSLLKTQPTGSAPLLALSSGMQSKDARDTVVTWFEENHLTGRVGITNNAGTGTTFTVSERDATQVKVGDIYVVHSNGEYVFVNAVSGTTVTVSRGFAQSTSSAVDGSSTPVKMQRVGSVAEEGAARPEAIANLGFPRFNYVQIFANAWDVTGTAKAIEYHTGDVVAKNKRDAALFHAEDIERSLIWGRMAVGIMNGQPFRTMDGFRYQLQTNIKTQATNTTWDDLDDFLQAIFSINIKGKPNERIALCGNTVLRVLNKIVRLETNAQINIEPGETEFGLKIQQWMTPYGDISLLTHPLMNENPIWTKDMIVLHPGAMRMRWLRRTFEDNYDRAGTRAGRDADYGVIRSELSMEYMAERTGGYYIGIDTAAAST